MLTFELFSYFTFFATFFKETKSNKQINLNFTPCGKHRLCFTVTIASLRAEKYDGGLKYNREREREKERERGRERGREGGRERARENCFLSRRCHVLRLYSVYGS
jgi:hypothetical protein